MYDVDLIDPEILGQVEKRKTRLTALAGLTDGWLDGEGEAIDREVLRVAKSFLAKRPALAENYKIFPNVNGGIVFEFKTGNWDLSIEFSKPGTIELYGVEVDGSDEIPNKTYETLDEQFLSDFDRYVGVLTAK